MVAPVVAQIIQHKYPKVKVQKIILLLLFLYIYLITYIIARFLRTQQIVVVPNTGSDSRIGL